MVHGLQQFRDNLGLLMGGKGNPVIHNVEKPEIKSFFFGIVLTGKACFKVSLHTGKVRKRGSQE